MALEDTHQQTISVVITCYQEGELLREAVESALSQGPCEIVVVNDSSMDEMTNEVCRQIVFFPTVTVIWRLNNGGPSIARNHGFEVAKGDILVPLDADDLLPDNALTHIAQAFGNNETVGFVYGAYIRQDTAHHPGSTILPQDISLQHMLSAKPFSLSSRWQLLGTTPLRKEVWQRLDGYDPTFGKEDLHDVEFWIRVIASGCQHIAIDKPIYIWRKYLGSNSRQVTPLSWYEIAQKYFYIYQMFDLEYRAYELLLVGSKWLGEDENIHRFRRNLFQCARTGNVRFSSFLALAIPAQLLQVLAKQAAANR